MTKMTICRVRPRFAAVCAALLLAGAACENPTEPGPAGITVIPPASVSDTAEAVLSQPLVVEVRDSAGRLQRGVTVRFEAGTASLGGQEQATLSFSSEPDEYRTDLQVVTDGNGRAAVRVRLGIVATTAAVRISVPTQGFETTTSFTIRPGATIRTVALPYDTAVYVGGAFAPRAAALDRWGNLTAVPVTAAVSDAPGVASAGASVTGVALGRTRVMVTAGGAQYPVFVSVVPRGTLLAARADGIYTFNLDGSGYRRVVQAQDARAPRWFPDGQSFVFNTGLGHASVASLATGAVRPLVAGANSLDGELWPHPSRDGQWVYFGGYTGAGFRGYPYRVRADGTGLQLIPGFVEDDHTQAHPSPSPTGDRVAYFREGTGNAREVTLRILNIQTGQLVLRDVPGHSPEWSHGDSIAYLGLMGADRGPILLMSSAGGFPRMLGTGTQYDFGIDWSPDDQWIVARDMVSLQLEVIRVSTGQRIPLPFTIRMWNPAWRP